MAHSNQQTDGPRDIVNELLRRHPIVSRGLLVIAGFTIAAVLAEMAEMPAIAGMIAAYGIIFVCVIVLFVLLPVHLLSYLN